MSDNKSDRLFQKAHGNLNNTVRCKVMLWWMSGGGGIKVVSRGETKAGCGLVRVV